MPSEVLNRLLELTGLLLETQAPLERVLQIITDQALELFPGDHASVRLLDDTGTRLLCGARSGVGVQNRPMVFRAGEGAIGWVAETGRPIRLADGQYDSRFKPSDRQGFSIRSVLAVPLQDGGKVVGVMGVSSANPDAFRGGDEVVARLLGNCVSAFIARARLERLSVTDPATMAFNARCLLSRLVEEFERVRRNRTRLSVMALAVSSEGSQSDVDARMQAAADRVRLAARLSDSLVRVSGHRLLLIMPDMDREEAAGVCERVRSSLLDYSRGGEPTGPAAHLALATWNERESAEDLVAQVMASIEQTTTG